MALKAGSIAVDHIKSPCGTTPDQRGVARPQGAGCDAGSYELAPPDVSAGTASNATTSGAVLSAQITPNARSTTWHVEYGPTAAYGSRTADQTIGSAAGATSVSVRLTGLTAGTTFHSPPPASPKFAGVGLPKGPLRANAKAQIRITVSCPRTTAGSCRGTLTLSRKIRTKRGRKQKPKVKTVILAHAGFTIAPGTHKVLTLKLGAGARASLAAAGRRGLAVILAATAHDAKGTSAKASVATKVKKPKKAKKPKRRVHKHSRREL